MKLDNLQEALTFDDVLLVPQYSHLISSSDTDVSWELGPYKFRVPVIAANMDTICGEQMAKKMAELGGLGIIHRYQPVYGSKEYLLNSGECYEITASWWAAKKRAAPLAFSVGSIRNDKFRIDWAVDTKYNRVDIICVDIAHGDSIHMLETLEYIRERFSGPIIAGNVCTPEATSFLLEHGATIVKVGVGPGSVCTTRIKTGNGYPQLEAIARCAEAGPVIADGGIRTPGDVAKALAVGAKAVMIGGMLAGTDCVPGWTEAMSNIGDLDPNPQIRYRGMASNEARASLLGVERIQKDLIAKKPMNEEGVGRYVTCKPAGSTEGVIMDIVEGVKRSMSYQGADNLVEFAKKAKFVRVSASAQAENHPHFKG